MTPRKPRITAHLCAAALAAIYISAAACSSSQSAPLAGQQPDRPITTTRTAPMPRAAQTGPIVSGDAQGLEVHWWIADDAHADIPRLLEPFIDDPLPESPALRAKWNEAGLRMVRFPLDHLPAIRAGTTPLAEHTRNWHHAAAVWGRTLPG